MIFHKIQKETNQDMDILKTYMKSAIEGNYQLIGASELEDKDLAITFNEMIQKFVTADNRVVLDLNQSMETIGNCNHVRKMLHVVDHQMEELQDVMEIDKVLTDSMRENEKTLNQINDHIHIAYEKATDTEQVMSHTVEMVAESYQDIVQADSAMNGFSEKSEAINDILKTVSGIANRTQMLALNAKIEASRAGDKGKGFAVVANEVGQLSVNTQKAVEQMNTFITSMLTDVHQLVKQMDYLKEILTSCQGCSTDTREAVITMAGYMEEVKDQINDMFSHMKSQNENTEVMIRQITEMAAEADKLEEFCKEPGKDMQTISRAIDGIRSYVAREQAVLTDQEWIEVFTTDHLIFTDRLFNMIVGFEQLQIENLNNPNKCKFGKWCNKQIQANKSIESLLKPAMTQHDLLHKKATQCFDANRNGSRDEALQCYDEAREIYGNFKQEMELLSKQL